MKTKEVRFEKDSDGRWILVQRGGRASSTHKSIKDYNRKTAKKVIYE